MKKISLMLVLIFLVGCLFGQNIVSNRMVDDFDGTIEQQFIFTDVNNPKAILVVFFAVVDGKQDGIGIALTESYNYFGSDNPKMMYKFDDGDVITTTGMINTAGTLVFIREKIKFYDLMFISNTVIFRIYDYQNEAHNYKFNLTGFQNKYDEIMK